MGSRSRLCRIRAVTLRVLALALAACAVGHALVSAAREGWTYDEAFHLQWSERFLDTGVTERVSQERFNSKTPIMVPGVLARKAARALGVTEMPALRFAARAPSAVWLAVLLALVYMAGRRISPVAGVLALAAAALDPNLAAHASLATADLPFACAVLATLVAADAAWRRPSALRGAVVGAALGLAFVAKVSAFLLLPGLALLPWLSPRARDRSSKDGATDRARAALLVFPAALAVAWVVVCGAYAFSEFATPLSSLALRSTPFTRLAASLPSLRLPVPAAFLTAFDASLASERREWNVLLLGRRHPRGVWYYFAVVWALKTPLLLMCAEAWGLVRAASDARLRRDPFVRLLAWNALLAFAYFSFAFHAQIGFRYVLMLVPLGYVMAAAGLGTLSPSRRGVALGVLVVASAVAETAPYAGDPLAFTNALVQPKRLAYRWLADSNIDWGQNRERLGSLLDERDWKGVWVDPVHIVPGRNVVDLNLVAGVADPEPYRWVRENLEPRGHLAHTWLWYDVDADAFNRFLYHARRHVPGPLDAALCPLTLDYALRARDTDTPFAIRRAPVDDETWVACVVVKRDTDVGLRVLEGGVAAGTFTAGDACRTDTVAKGQEAWWRLEPGVHALCVVAPPNRRRFLPYNFESAWMVRGWGVRLSVRPLIPETTPPPPEATSPRSSSPPRPRAG